MKEANSGWEGPQSRPLPLCLSVSASRLWSYSGGWTLNPPWLFDAKGNLWMWWFPRSDWWNLVASDFPVMCQLCQVISVCGFCDVFPVLHIRPVIFFSPIGLLMKHWEHCTEYKFSLFSKVGILIVSSSMETKNKWGEISILSVMRRSWRKILLTWLGLANLKLCKFL